jgi:recombinational DNA repair protein (RecF pathway)
MSASQKDAETYAQHYGNLMLTLNQVTEVKQAAALKRQADEMYCFVVIAELVQRR